MSEFVNTIDLLGDNAVLDSIIDKSITEFNDDVITSIGWDAFHSCKNLNSVSLPNVKKIEHGCFNSSGIREAYMPLLEELGGDTFRWSSLTSVDFPVLTKIGTYDFDNCHSLLNVRLPLLGTLGNASFNLCSKLTTVDLGVANNIGQYVFNGCSQLTRFILRNTSKVCGLAGTSSFGSTPIANGTGYIYVPRELIEDYKVATNWSTYANQFRALEDYTVDGTTTGELDETKI